MVLLLNSYYTFGFILELINEKWNDYINSLSRLNLFNGKKLPIELEKYTFIEGKNTLSKFENLKAYNYLFLLFKTFITKTKHLGYSRKESYEDSYKLSNLEETYLNYYLTEEGLSSLFNFCFTISGKKMKIASNKLTSALNHLTFENCKKTELLIKFYFMKILAQENEKIKVYLIGLFKKLKVPGKEAIQIVVLK